MGIALYTTLVGAVLHVWLIVNHRMLATGALHLYNAIVELDALRHRHLDRLAGLQTRKLTQHGGD